MQSQFASMLGTAGILTDEESLSVHNTDWTGQFRGHSELVLQPASTSEVAAVLKYCNEHGCAGTCMCAVCPLCVAHAGL